jgi:hypothetical protein
MAPTRNLRSLSLWSNTDLVLAGEHRRRALADDHAELERSMHDVVELRNRLSHGEDIAPTREDWLWATRVVLAALRFRRQSA